MPKILFTGGGSAGHVTPNLALIEPLRQQGFEIFYAGSDKSIEKTLVERMNIPFFAISSGKLRRYFSWKTFFTPFQIIQGIFQAFFLCRKLKPQIIFSKGGFVAFPIVVAGWLNRIPVIAHESDLTPGLANRLSFPFAKIICVTFPEGKKFFKDSVKVKVTGTPLRANLFKGSTTKGLAFCGFSAEKPILMVVGGGLGAEKINQAIWHLLPVLLKQFQIIHLCGKGKIDHSIHVPGYKQFEYVNEEIADLFACTDIIISRAGANSLYELLALHKPHLLIPLSKTASRGDQISNADYFSRLGLSQVLWEENLDNEKLMAEINFIYQHRKQLQQKLRQYELPDSVKVIMELIWENLKNK